MADLTEFEKTGAWWYLNAFLNEDHTYTTKSLRVTAGIIESALLFPSEILFKIHYARYISFKGFMILSPLHWFGWWFGLVWFSLIFSGFICFQKSEILQSHKNRDNKCQSINLVEGKKKFVTVWSDLNFPTKFACSIHVCATEHEHREQNQSCWFCRWLISCYGITEQLWRYNCSICISQINFYRYARFDVYLDSRKRSRLNS